MERRRLFLLTALSCLLLGLLVTGCRTVRSEQAVDTDHDLITDTVERQLGTDPCKRDTDGDGLTDWYELFGRSGTQAGEISKAQGGRLSSSAASGRGGEVALAAETATGGTEAPETVPMARIVPISELPKGELPDHDSDGKHDALDRDQYFEDADGDGLCNGFEGAGCFLDLAGKEATLTPWIGQTHQQYRGRTEPVVVFRSNPLDPDSDGDGYGDGQEVRGQCPKSIASPGTHPLVPAMPVLSAEIQSVVVTRKAKITTTHNKELQNSWTQNVKSERSTVTDFSESLDAKADIDTKGARGEVRAHVGKKTRKTDSCVVTTNQSNFNREEWSSAEQIDTGDAAMAKITFSVYNVGTSPAYGCRPQFTVGVGSGDTAIETMDFQDNETFNVMPGSSYGPVERTVTLDIDELKAFMTGAPIWVTFTQYRAKNDKGSEWDKVMAEALQSSTCYIVDNGTGVVAPVYVSAWYKHPANEVQASVPISALGDALNYAFSYVEGDKLNIRDPGSGGTYSSALDGWRFALSKDGDESLAALWKEESAAGKRLVQLEPSSKDVIVAKAPPRGEKAFPHGNWASCEYDKATKQLVVRACADDYFALDSVYYRSPRSKPTTYPMSGDSGVYKLTVPGSLVRSSADRIVARNDRGVETSLPIATPEALDFDAGGLKDVWEMAHGSNPSNKADDATLDSDHGLIADIREMAAGAKPLDPSDDLKIDSDKGGTTDYDEIDEYKTDPDDKSDDKLMRVYVTKTKLRLKVKNLTGVDLILRRVEYKADHYDGRSLPADPQGWWPATMFDGLGWQPVHRWEKGAVMYGKRIEAGEEETFEWKNCWPWTNRTWEELRANRGNVRFTCEIARGH